MAVSSKAGGYDFELVGEMIKEYECPICLLLIRKAIELPCTHVLCKTCLEECESDCFLKTKSPSPRCPSCKVEYERDKVHESKFVDRIIQTSLKVKCVKNRNGCDWTGTISDHVAHENNCVYQEVQCLNTGCNERMIRQKLDQHKEYCPYRLLPCSYCSEIMSELSLKGHWGTTCPMCRINCTNKYCETVVPRHEMESHCLKDCSYQEIDCEFKFVGCDTMIPRKDLPDHADQSIQKHMTLLVSHTSNLTQKLEINQKELENVKQELDVTKTKFVSELQDVKIELAAYKTNLPKDTGKDIQSISEISAVKYLGSENERLEELFFSNSYLPGQDMFIQQFSILANLLIVNEYYKYDRAIYFIRISLESMSLDGIFRLAAAKTTKSSVKNDLIMFHCKNLFIMKTAKNEYCIYLSQASLSQDIKSVTIHHPFRPKGEIMFYRTAIHVTDAFEQCAFLQINCE